MVNRNLPCSSVLKEMVLNLRVQRVITPLLPPVPGDTLTDPSHMLSRRIILALWVSWRNTIHSLFLKRFFSLLIVCNNLRLQVSPLQLIVTISNNSRGLVSSTWSGPGLDSIPAASRADLISANVRVLSFKNSWKITNLLTSFLDSYLGLRATNRPLGQLENQSQ